MDVDEIDDAIAALQRDRDQLREKVDRLRRDHDTLSGKLRFPGTKFLVDLEYKLVLDTTITAAASTLTVPAGFFESLPGALHAVYCVSALCTDSNIPVVITDGSIIVAPAGAISVGVQRQLKTTPTRIESQVAIYNSVAAPHDVAVRIWRRLGMGS